MRTIPVDTTKIDFISTGKAAARAEYVELSDGSRRRSGNQAKDESGMPLWVVDVFVDDPEADRAEVVGVKVASWDEPIPPKFQKVKFRNLVAVPYVDQRSNRVALSFRADGIEGAPAAAKAPAA
jgi:hypothetical protein